MKIVIRVEKNDAVDTISAVMRTNVGLAQGVIGPLEHIVIEIRTEHDEDGQTAGKNTKPKLHLSEMSRLMCELLEESGKSQAAVANELGVAAGTLHSARMGLFPVPDRLLPLLHKAFGVPENDQRITQIIEIVRASRLRRRKR